MEAPFLINSKSRSGAKLAEEAKTVFEEQGVSLSEVTVCTGGEMGSRLRQFVEKGAPIVLVGGGDGTQRMAASVLAGSSTALGIVPLGTGNALARDLGLSVKLPECAAQLATGTVTPIDVGLANDQPFVNVATIGLSALIARNLDKKLKGPLGRLVYLPAVIKALQQLRPFHLQVRTDLYEFDGSAVQFVAAAGRTHAGPFVVTRRAQNDDGLLSLYALSNTDKMGMFKYGIGLLTGLHTILSEVWSCEARTAVVETGTAKAFIIDGDRGGNTPLKLEIKPRALKVLIPAPEPTTKAGQ
ncbi:MAG: YegS/Rv2252/BmrU family lipid kinase [Armatimonadetes bacterium]|nr:YegS/Rv2252/BmrU family lipid kinase [Armatimonadota bacterium]